MINRFNPFKKSNKDYDDHYDEVETIEIAITPQSPPRICDNVYVKEDAKKEEESFHFILNKQESSEEKDAELQGVISEIVNDYIVF
jgi:hypothetical protein